MKKWLIGLFLGVTLLFCSQNKADAHGFNSFGHVGFTHVGFNNFAFNRFAFNTVGYNNVNFATVGYNNVNFATVGYNNVNFVPYAVGYPVAPSYAVASSANVVVAPYTALTDPATPCPVTPAVALAPAVSYAQTYVAPVPVAFNSFAYATPVGFNGIGINHVGFNGIGINHVGFNGIGINHVVGINHIGFNNFNRFRGVNINVNRNFVHVGRR